MEFYGFLFFLAGTLLFGILLFVVALVFRRFRRYFLLSFLALPSAVFLLGFITTTLLDNACGPDLAYGPDGEQSFQYCAATWPDRAVYPLWLLSTAIVWLLTYLLERSLNGKYPFWGGQPLPEEPSKTTTSSP
jgi:hypothetical protein